MVTSHWRKLRQEETNRKHATQSMHHPLIRTHSWPNLPVFPPSQACPSCWGLQAAPLPLALWSDPCRSWRILSQRSGQLYRDQKIPPSPRKGSGVSWRQQARRALLAAPPWHKATASLPTSTPLTDTRWHWSVNSDAKFRAVLAEFGITQFCLYRSNLAHYA